MAALPGRWALLSGRGRPRAATALLLGAVVLVGIAAPFGAASTGPAPSFRVIAAPGAAQNSSSDGDPTSSSASTLCPSAGPVFLGVQWNCVALLDLTEVLLILVSVGIVAYVFRGADRAELPGEAAEVPVTDEEWEEYRKARKLGHPWRPRPPAGGGPGS